MTEVQVYEEEPRGPYHDFWLLREGERSYEDYWDLLGREDAPVRVPDATLMYFYDSLLWIPTADPAWRNSPPGYGLNLFGPTIINQRGGCTFAEVFRGWAHLLSQGPETLLLSAGRIYTVGENGQNEDPQQYRLTIPRDPLLRDLNLLADWGRLAVSGKFFILHLGV